MGETFVENLKIFPLRETIYAWLTQFFGHFITPIKKKKMQRR